MELGRREMEADAYVLVLVFVLFSGFWHKRLKPYFFLQSNRGGAQPSKRKPLPPLPLSVLVEERIQVKALYDFMPREPCNLALKRAEEYLILERCDPHWWKARDRLG